MVSSRGVRLRIGCLLLVLVIWGGGWTGRAEAQAPPPSGTLDVPPDQVEDLIRLLEDEQARAAFVQRLKALARLQAEPGGPQAAADVGVLARLMVGVELAAQHTLTTVQHIVVWFSRAPEHARTVWRSFTTPERRREILRVLQHLVLSLVPAALVGFALRRVLAPLQRLSLPAAVWPWLQRLWRALLQVVVRVLPIGGVWVAAVTLLQLMAVEPVVEETVRFLLTVLLGYELVSQSLWALLAPEDAAARVLPFTDDNAGYLWVWTRRFVGYGVFYALAMEGLRLAYGDPRAYQGIRGLLLCAFPALVTVFVAQVARHQRRPRTAPSAEAGEEVFQTTRRILRIIWPFLTVIYAWALTGFLILHYAGGMRFLIGASIKSVLVTVALLLGLRLFNMAFEKAFRIGDRLRQRFPLLEEKANRYLALLQNVCNGLLVLLAVAMIFEFWGLPVSWFVTSPVGLQILTRAVIIALTAVLTVAVIGLSRLLGDVLLQPTVDAGGVVREPDRKRKTLVPLTHAVLKVGVIFVAVLIVLTQLGVNVGPVLAGVGILGLAVGFGSQSLVKDVINGLFILFEDSLSVGDVAVLRGTGGLVEKVTLRAVTLRDLSGNVHVIPNSSIDMVTNMTKEYSRYVLDVGVAYREDVDEVIAILREVDAEMRAEADFGKDMLEPIEILGLDRFADSALIVRARLKTKPIQQWRIGREFNRRLKKRFDERGIEIPFPHRTLYWGMPKGGPQAPIHVAVEDTSLAASKA